MKAHAYAQALLAEYRKHDVPLNTLFDHFTAVLEKNNHRQLLPSILGELERMTAGGEAKDTAVLTVAREKDASAAKKALKTLLPEHAGVSEPTIIVNDSLIGGFKFRTRTTLIDGSYATMLTQLFNKIKR